MVESKKHLKRKAMIDSVAFKKKQAAQIACIPSVCTLTIKGNGSNKLTNPSKRITPTNLTNKMFVCSFDTTFFLNIKSKAKGPWFKIKLDQTISSK